MTTPDTSTATNTVTSTDAACPDCGGALTDDERFTRWCPACRWNALPSAGQGKVSGPAPSGRRPLAGRLDRSAEERLFAEVSAAAADGRTLRPTLSASRYAAAALALPVHLVTLALLAVGYSLLALGTWVADVFGVAVVLIAVFLRPRLGRYSRVRKSAPAPGRERAPELWALADAVADRLGTRRADAILLNSAFNASYRRVGLRRRVVLTIGVPLWYSLEPQERVALLAHEFGHGANGDATSGFWLGTALTSLAQWYEMLLPGRRLSGGRSAGGGIAVIGEALAQVVMFAIRGLVVVWFRLLERLTLAGSRRAEYLADGFAVRLAGADGAAGLLGALMLPSAYWHVVHQRTVAAQWVPRRRDAKAEQADTAEKGERAEKADRPAAPAERRAPETLWTELQDYVRSIPETERTRRIVADELSDAVADGSHPPTHLRVGYVRAFPGAPAELTPSAETWDAIAGELRPYADRLAAHVLDR
ncbi:M48 family metallopeptidase [Streptacidiphilus fuscans]|uniref:M48 family metalloprotease n=1 Tax=Streptacidiphilus fuscans TaxID=2789292 RepID=A0A931BAK3_9ACTN|nr:M48 family metallopeptidase [Streptacidiphilus fuscans]MBF9073076.1 M48 family metalloprotease [Streptacidiphilus fuscans]